MWKSHKNNLQYLAKCTNLSANLDNATCKRGYHRKTGASVCPYNRVQCLTEHIKRNAERNIKEVFLGMLKGLFIDRSAEERNNLLAENQINGTEQQAADKYHNNGIANAFRGVFTSFLPRLRLTNAQQPSPIMKAIASAMTVSGNTTVFAAFPYEPR